MEFIRVFDNDSAYLSYRNGAEYTRPNVSLSRDTNEVHYNYPIWDANGKDYVDLGLPSGTLWATMNVGASNPSDRGLYFQWGDTAGYTKDQVGTGDGKKKFASDWSDYKWGAYPNFSKYTTTGATLELEDDAAHANMGGDWHMPSTTQIQELIDNTTTAWTQSYNVTGMTFTSTKDTSKSIFIPMAGYANDGLVNDNVIIYQVWGNMLGTDDVIYGQSLSFSSGDVGLNDYGRCGGLSVRGVLG